MPLYDEMTPVYYNDNIFVEFLDQPILVNLDNFIS